MLVMTAFMLKPLEVGWKNTFANICKAMAQKTCPVQSQPSILAEYNQHNNKPTWNQKTRALVKLIKLDGVGPVYNRPSTDKL